MPSPQSQVPDSTSSFRIPDSQFSRSRFLEFEILNLELSQTRQPSNAPVFKRFDVNGLLLFDKSVSPNIIHQQILVSIALPNQVCLPAFPHHYRGRQRPPVVRKH